MSDTDYILDAVLSENKHADWDSLKDRVQDEIIELIAKEDDDGFTDYLLNFSEDHHLILARIRNNFLGDLDSDDMAHDIKVIYEKNLRDYAQKYCDEYLSDNRHRYDSSSEFTQQPDIPLDIEGKARG